MVRLVSVFLWNNSEHVVMKSRFCVAFLISLSLAFAAEVASAKKQEPPQTTIEGLVLLDDTEFALVYMEPGADLSRYSRIYLVDTFVAFKKNWLRDQNKSYVHKISTSDMDKMKTELAGLFRDVFTEVLEQGGYELVTERAEDVLIIKPAIINLNIAAPENKSTSDRRTYSESVGEMTLYLELYDSVTNDLIAKALDRQTDRETGYFQWQTQVRNRAAANRILKVWANVLKDGLDKARDATSP